MGIRKLALLTFTDELLDRERNSMSLRKPRTRAYHSIINYYWNEKPIVKSETAFLNLADDFVILSGDQDSSFHSALERFIGKSRIKPLKVRFFNTKQLGVSLTIPEHIFNSWNLGKNR